MKNTSNASGKAPDSLPPPNGTNDQSVAAPIITLPEDIVMVDVEPTTVGNTNPNVELEKQFNHQIKLLALATSEYSSLCEQHDYDDTHPLIIK
ncbi:hypothetical protein ABG067_008979, partial [Albugo candida]